ncbi:MAG TPA: hypothetical protein VMX55_05045 [candidate division Zixibacteria bacterium]|nr:hypothetical protein [candidate division Zixibacteria bacterium]
MFDKIRRSASKAVKRVVGDAVEDAAEKETRKQVSKVETQYKEESAKAFKEMKAKKIPGKLFKDFGKFKGAWEKNADEPEQSVLFLLIAAYNYCKNPKIGEPMATLILSNKHNQKSSSSPSGYVLGPTNKELLKHMAEDINIAKSYLGANYEDDYKFNEDKIAMDLLGVQPEDETGKYVKVFIKSGGKDMPTPVGLARNKDGQWKITEFSSIATGCRKPSSVEDDF